MSRRWGWAGQARSLIDRAAMPYAEVGCAYCDCHPRCCSRPKSDALCGDCHACTRGCPAHPGCGCFAPRDDTEDEQQAARQARDDDDLRSFDDDDLD